MDGDFSKGLQGMVAGAASGSTAAGALAELAEPDRVMNTINDIGNWKTTKAEQLQYNADVINHGEEEAALRAQNRNNERQRQKFMKDKNEQRKFADMSARIKEKTGQSVDVKTLMKADWDYRKAGIDDAKLREKALNAEMSYGGVGGVNHEKMIDIADYSTKFSKDYIMDEKKNKQLKGQLQKELRGNTAAQTQVEEMLAKLYGVKKIY